MLHQLMQISEGERVLRILIIISAIAWILPLAVVIASALIFSPQGYERVGFLFSFIIYSYLSCSVLCGLYLYVHLFKWGKEGREFSKVVELIGILCLTSILFIGSMI